MRATFYYALILGFSIFSSTSFGQIFDPFDVEAKAVKLSDGKYKLIVEVEIEEGWSTYSQISEDEFGPFPTSILIETEGVKTENEIAEECGNMEKKFDPVFELELTKFHDRAVFIHTLNTQADQVSGLITLQACDSEKCLPPEDYEFSVDLKEVKELDEFNKDDFCSENGESGSLDASPSDIKNPVEWVFGLKKKDSRQYEFVAKASIQEGWKIYGPHPYGFDGPIITKIYYDSLQTADTLGGVQISSDSKKKAYDPFFEMDLTTLKNNATYKQGIQSQSGKEIIKGFIEYQACDSVQCLLPEMVDFIIDLEKEVAYIKGGKIQNFSTTGEGTPVYAEFDYEWIESSCGLKSSTEKESGSFLWIFLGGFLGGFVALLTPCVFPMIPLTVSFFTKSSKDRKSGIRNAFIYGLSIIVIYVGLGILVTTLFGADALNQLSTNAWFNILFFVLFVIFALSFFGFFEITLPSSWSNKTDRAADRGGLIGIFFMAFTLSLVSFSCTGPIIGTLLVETATGNGPTLGNIPAGPLVGMLGFAVALALPFALFAAFPSWLNSLPQSGSWMNGVKVVLGFVELALALKFLSVADLTMGWKILPYELFVALWILCALGIAFYFFGWLKLPVDMRKPGWNTKRAVVGFAAVLIAAYISTGFTYSDRNKTFVTPTLLSGLAPPAGHSFIHPNKCPLNLNCFKDYQKGVAYAKENNKPILIDFTGHGCVNCRKMEDQVWSKEKIYDLIDKEFVLISLYGDERTPLNSSYISKFDEEEKTTIGHKWTDFQMIHFKSNSQPLYVLVSPEGKILNKPVGYSPDVEAYYNFLNCGLERFSEQKKGMEIGNTDF